MALNILQLQAFVNHMDIIICPLHPLRYAHNTLNQKLLFTGPMAFLLVRHCLSRRPHLVGIYPVTTLPFP
jgi:hypothetical protein